MLREIFNVIDCVSAVSSVGPVVGQDIRMETDAATRSSMQHVEERIEKLVLVTMAMWSLLRENTELTEEDLLDRMREIDLQDGQEDGKVARQIARCTHCDRVMSPRHSKCLYCGEKKLNLTGFDGAI